MNRFGWAYIGCGGIARTTAKELVQTEDNHIVAVWNRTKSKAEEFAKEFGGTVYDTAEEAINAVGVEGVYVNVTGDKHAEYTLSSIKNKKPVLCEKPFTVNVEKTKEIFDYAKEKNTYVSEAMWTWHNDTALQVKDWVLSGAVGEVKDVECVFMVPLLKHGDIPRLTRPDMLGGALMDLGVYAIRYCYELFGNPDSIHCVGDVREVDYSETITFQYPDFKATLRISMIEEGEHYFEVKGSKGSILIPEFHMSKQALLKTDQEKTFEMEGLLYGTQFSNVATEIRAEKKEGEKISAKSTIDVMALMDECRKQMGLVFPEEMVE